MVKLQRINKFLERLNEKECKYYLRALLNDTLTVDDVMEDVNYDQK